MRTIVAYGSRLPVWGAVVDPKKLLDAIKTAMENSESFADAVTWKESKWDTPELVPVVSDNTVDKEKFKQFERILNFLVLGIFGVDEEGRGRGQLVDFYLKDRTRDATELPFWRVPRIRYREATLRDVVNAREKAQFHADSTRKLVERYDHEIKSFLDLQFVQEDFKARAEDCKACEGRGYTVLDRETYRERERKADYGDRHYQRSGSGVRDYLGVPYRGVLCDDCQPDEIIQQALRHI